MALEEVLNPPGIVVLRGEKQQLIDWQKKLSEAYRPWVFAVALPTGLCSLPATLDKPLRPGVNAWVCSGVKCLEPINDFSCLERVCKSPELI